MRFDQLGLRLRVFLFFAFLGLASLAAIMAGAYLGYQRLGDPAALSAFVLGGLVAGGGVLGLTLWVWFLFDENVAQAIQKLAGGMLARAHADVIDDIDHAPAKYLGDLAPAAAAVTANLSQTRSALAEAVERETEQVAREKERLAALLADVPEGVLLCSGRHQLVFYNGAAAGLLTGDGAEPALDRSVFRVLRDGPIRQAHARLCAGDAAEASDLLCATSDAGRVLSARMRLVASGAETGAPGYVLTLRDVTADLAVHGAREALLAEIFDRIRRPAANLQTVLDAADVGGAPPAAALAGEVRALAHAVTELGVRYDRSRADWWPKGMHRAGDLIDGVVAQLAHAGLSLTAEGAPLSLRCDAYQIVALLAHLAERLVAEEQASVLSLRIAPDEGGAGAMISLGWAGGPLALGRLEAWLAAPLDIGMADMDGRAVLQAHGTEVWPEPGLAGRAVLRLPIPQARPQAHPDDLYRRGAVYDFDLLTRDVGEDLLSTPLSDLTYVVFDTETTGLLPDEGDEIVQIAGMRVVNGRRVAGEAFDALVNPGRKIPATSTKVHGITDVMVTDAPAIAQVGRRFHRFAEGAVLVAHNAPFDMAFLKRHARGIGAKFDHPVLDTVLLSAVLFGQSETHTLDALCDRLGITIAPELRHTAMGDTVATADVFLKMLSMLKGRGIVTFGDILTEVRRHKRLLEDLN